MILSRHTFVSNLNVTRDRSHIKAEYSIELCTTCTPKYISHLICYANKYCTRFET